jgi:HlyD family secretion protein
MFKKAAYVLLAGIVALGAAGCSLGVKEDSNKYTATVEAESFYIPVEVSGKVTEVSIEQGSTVKEDQVIAKVSSEVYELQKKQAEASLKIAKSKKDDLPDSAKESLEEQAEATVEQAQAAVDLAKLQVEKSEIKAQGEGVVSEVFIKRGEMASAGINIAKVINLKDKYIKVFVEEEKRSLVKLGDTIPVYFNGEKKDEGKIVYVSSQSEFTPKNVEKKSDKEKTVFEIKVKLSEGLELYPGMMVDIIMQGEK